MVDAAGVRLFVVTMAFIWVHPLELHPFGSFTRSNIRLSYSIEVVVSPYLSIIMLWLKHTMYLMSF